MDTAQDLVTEEEDAMLDPLPAEDHESNATAEGLQAGTGAENIPIPKRDINELRNPPVHVAVLRQLLFDLKEPVDLKVDEFERYWPFVDNIWVRQHRAGTDKTGRFATDYYACRLQRPTYTPRKSDPRPDGKPLRKKQTREGGTCQMRIKTLHYVGVCQKVTISRVGEHEHTHDLEHMDKIKRNTVIMDIARSEVMKGYMPASVFTVMHEDEEKLTKIGGKHMNRNDVRNASQAWRQLHKEQLQVHPGYRYDHGNGIIFNEETGAAAPAPRVPPLDPALQSPFPLDTLPPDALYLPEASQQLLAPYLPSRDAQIPPAGGLPHVTLTYAVSMDSFLAISPGQQTVLSGPASKAMTHFLRSRHDAILIGVGTAVIDNPTLNCRFAGAGGYGGIGWTHQPRPVVIDPGARWLITPASNVLQAVAKGKGRGPWIVVAPGFSLDPRRTDMLKEYGGKYLGLPDVDMRYRLRWSSIFRALAQEGIRSVMVEGGGTVINELLQPDNVGLISSAVVTVSPTYLGTGGVVVCPTRAYDAQGRPKPVVRFKDPRWLPLGEDVVMAGRMAVDGDRTIPRASEAQPQPPGPISQAEAVP